MSASPGVRAYVLDAHGEPLRCDDPQVWADWYERASQDRSRILAQDLDEGDPAVPVQVSTVFLALDHNWSPHGPPILWETMVFGGPLDGETERYSSRDTALAGHQAMCQRVSAIHSGAPPCTTDRG